MQPNILEDLREVAVLYHDSSLLSYKLQEVLEKHLTQPGQTCGERGCTDYSLDTEHQHA